jgi:hypothetical protein
LQKLLIENFVRNAFFCYEIPSTVRILKSNAFDTRSNFVRIASKERNRRNFLVGQNDQSIRHFIIGRFAFDDHQVSNGSVVVEDVQRLDDDRVRAVGRDCEFVDPAVAGADVHQVGNAELRLDGDHCQPF